MSTALPIPEPALLLQAAGGSETAFTQLFYHHRHKLYSFLHRLTGSPEMTEDVIQEIFLKLWKNRTTLAGIENLGSYLFRMAENQCLTHFKRMAKETLILKELSRDPQPAAGDAESAISTKELQGRLHDALAKLPPQQKLVYTLSREQGLKHEEIAERLAISPSTVKNHMIKALSSLRQQLAAHTDTAFVAFFLALIEAFEK